MNRGYTFVRVHALRSPHPENRSLPGIRWRRLPLPPTHAHTAYASGAARRGVALRGQSGAIATVLCVRVVGRFGRSAQSHHDVATGRRARGGSYWQHGGGDGDGDGDGDGEVMVTVMVTVAVAVTVTVTVMVTVTVTVVWGGGGIGSWPLGARILG